MDADAYYAELMQEVHARAEAMGTFTEIAFAEVVSEHLLDSGAIDGFEPLQYLHQGVRIDGWHFSPDDSLLELFIADCRGGDTAEIMTRTELERIFRRGEAFFVRSCRQTFVDKMETSHPAYGLARMIFEQTAELRAVRFTLFTNAKLTESVRELPSKSGPHQEWSYRVWDITRLAAMFGNGDPESLIIDFEALFGRPLVCLPAGNSSADVRSYLAVIPGAWLARIYDIWGGRLLEQNVRTFLQARGKVNKGIRKTILEEPHRFFPYNNGISATAEEVQEAQQGGITLVRTLKNLQIVNGGQTTASIYNVMKKDRSPTVSEISVAMKLSVVAPTIAEELVPKISRFANSQNRISDSDFFSNHPFHIVMQNLSAKLAAPAAQGSQILTHWFYERAKGQYANAMAYLTQAKKKEFQLKYPRSQVISKTDLAKYVQTFRELPHEVSLGAQKNFAKFAVWVGAEWEARQADFNEHWFKRAVVEAIIFRTTEKAVQGAPWYAQGYRANIVTYALALLMNRIRARALALDVQRIWREQSISTLFQTELLECGRVVQDALIDGARENGMANVTEWCKQKRCWHVVQNLSWQPSEAFLKSLLSQNDAQQELREARRERRAMTATETRVFVVQAGADFWKKVRDHLHRVGTLTPSESALLEIACSMPRRIPSERQCLQLMTLHERASETEAS